jgi:hypothetical protein
LKHVLSEHAATGTSQTWFPACEISSAMWYNAPSQRPKQER